MSLIAHQGGWDEILLVAGPMIVVIGVLALVKRRVEAAARAAEIEVDGAACATADGVEPDPR